MSSAQPELDKLVFTHVYAEHRVPTHAQDKRVALDPREVNESKQLQLPSSDNQPCAAADGGSTSSVRAPTQFKRSLTTEPQPRVRPTESDAATPVQISGSREAETARNEREGRAGNGGAGAPEPNTTVQISVTPEDNVPAVQISVSPNDEGNVVQISVSPASTAP